jgi:methylmalonyl-CoA mutase N-terminal domain/subunit
MAYVEAGIAAGLDVDSFAPRLSFFFDCHNSFFEEIAKFRAARRIWARKMRETYKAKDPRSWLMRFHTQTAGCSLTAQQPENNIVRVAYQALAAVLGGTQSLHTNSMDETLALPTEKAVQIALRTQQILACETGVRDTVDPLAGSYYMESLTGWMEEECEKYFDRIRSEGGVLECLNKGFFHREIARSSYRFQREVDENLRIIVGLNDYVIEDEDIEIPVLRIDPALEREKVRRLKELKAGRDQESVRETLASITEAARGTDNLVPHILKAVRAYVSLGEIVSSLREVFGEYREPVVF